MANKSKLVLLCVALNLRLATLNFNAHLQAAARVLPALLDSWSTSLPSRSQLPTYQQGGRSAAHQAAALEDDTWYPEFEVANIRAASIPECYDSVCVAVGLMVLFDGESPCKAEVS